MASRRSPLYWPCARAGLEQSAWPPSAPRWRRRTGCWRGGKAEAGPPGPSTAIQTAAKPTQRWFLVFGSSRKLGTLEAVKHSFECTCVSSTEVIN
eukprot:5020401-Pleurochrysis_carterae.AAC.2